MQKQRRRFYHMVNVYLGSYKRGRDPNDLQDFSCIDCPSVQSLNVCQVENVLLAVQDEECRCKLRSFRGYASQLYAKVDIHVLKSCQASPLSFCTLLTWLDGVKFWE